MSRPLRRYLLRSFLPCLSFLGLVVFSFNFPRRCYVMHTFIVRRAFARVSISLTVLVVVLGVGATRAMGAGAAPNGIVKIMNAHSGLCLSPAGGGRDRNVEIVQFTCDTDQARLW